LEYTGSKEKILSFSLNSKEKGFGEYHLAELVSKEIKELDLIPIDYDSSIVPENIEKVLFHSDQPHGDFSFFLILELCKAAHKNGVIVAFNGDGPDEVLAGFTHNQNFLASQTRTNFPLLEYFNRICFMTEINREFLLNKEFREKIVNPIDYFESILGDWRDLDPIDQIAAYECTSLGPGNNLIKTDRMGAALSIEGRSPFLDHRISEMFAKIPQSQKLQNSVSKFLLKEYGLKFFDRDLMFRKKSMPTLPIGEWIKGPLYEWALNTLETLDSSRYNVKNAIYLLNKHKQGYANHTKELRTLLMSSHWIKNFKSF